MRKIIISRPSTLGSRLLIPLLLSLPLFLWSCKTHKDVASQSSLTIDSLAVSERYRTIGYLDSLARSIDFTFDTLEITVERPTSVSQRSLIGRSQATQAEVIRLKAVKGRVIDRQRAHREQVEVYNRLDTVKYHQSAAETSTEHTSTTRIYNPPSGTALYVIGILAVACLFIYYCRK